MADAVDICNRALLRVGVTRFIESLDDETAEGQACNELFESSRDAVLSSSPWKFATKRSDLGVLTSVEREEWEFVYNLPTDCLVPRYIGIESKITSATQRIPFDLESNDAGDGQILVTDLEDAQLIYTARVTIPTKWPALFIDALAWNLAGDLALALQKDAVKSDWCMKHARRVLLEADAVQKQGAQDQEADSEFISGR